MPGNKTAFNMKVGIDIGATLSQFESDIATVISDFNAKQHNIKIGFDLKPVEEYKKAVDSATKEADRKLKNVGKNTGSLAPASAGRQAKQVVTDLTKAKDIVKEYHKLMAVFDKHKGKFFLDSDGKWGTTDKELKGVASRINEIIGKYKTLKNEMDNISSDVKSDIYPGLSQKDVERLEYMIELQKQKLKVDNSLRSSKTQSGRESSLISAEKHKTDEAIAAMKKFQEIRVQAAKLSDGVYMRKDGVWSSRKGMADQYSGQVRYFNEVTKKFYEMDSAVKTLSKSERQRYEQALKMYGSSAGAKIERIDQKRIDANNAEALKQEKKITDEAIATAQKFHSLMYEGSKGLKSGALSVDENGVWHARHKDYDQLEQSLNGITVKYQQMVSAVQNVSDAEKERFKTASKASKAEIVHLEDVRKRREDEIKGKKAIQDGYSSYAKMQKNLKNWSAAGGIFASKDTQAHYANYAKAADDLGKLVDGYASGKVTLKEFADGFTNITENAKVSGKAIQDAGKNTQSFGTSMATALKHIVNWVGATRLIMSGVKAIKDMAKTAIEIESSMAQLEIVTHATDSQMEAFLTKSTGLAKELGKSITEVLGSVETFSRLGYNLEDASGLAKYANILSNVANVDVDTATTGLTSIIKGYGMDVSNSEHVADVLVEVGQKYAISAEELMAAFQRGGAALAASGTDFEKSAALFAATNASLQNAESVGKHICPAA